MLLEVKGLFGLIGGLMLYVLVEYIVVNSIVILIFGMFVGSVYLKVIVCVLFLFWLGLGFGVWMLGNLGSVYLGVSGVIYGLMFLLVSFGLLCCDCVVIVIGLIGMLFYGGMLMIILLYVDGVFW